MLVNRQEDTGLSTTPALRSPLLTELDVARALPPLGFVRTYVLHAMRQTTAPLAYHLGVGLSILAATSPLAYGMNYAGDLRTNMYCLLIGRSGEDQKSTAINIGREILFTAAPLLIGDFPGSAEGLLESLANQPSQIIPISEFGKLLASAQRGYFEPIKTTLTDLWDAGPTQRAKANKKLIRIDNPRLSVMGGCSIPYLEKHTLAEDWTGGFMGRWAVMYAQRERTDPDPVGDNTLRPQLVEFLQQRATTPVAGWCTGLDAEAVDVWKDWYNDVSNRILPNNIIGIRSRAPTIARKVALLYGWDFGPAPHGEPWQMGMQVLGPAIKFAELHIKSLVALSHKIAEHPDARLRRSILDVVENQGGDTTLGAILFSLKMRKRPITEMLDSLCEEGTLVRAQTAEGTKFRMAFSGAY